MAEFSCPVKGSYPAVLYTLHITSLNMWHSWYSCTAGYMVLNSSITEENGTDLWTNTSFFYHFLCNVAQFKPGTEISVSGLVDVVNSLMSKKSDLFSFIKPLLLSVDHTSE